LTHYDASKDLILATDASGYGIGAVLMQKEGEAEVPIAHASKTLTDSQRNYSQIDKEALSIIYGAIKFRPYLYGRSFTLVTDHEPLVHIFSPEKNIPTLAAQRLQRWAITLRGYQYEIRYKPTDKHGNADGLSRLPCGADTQFDEAESAENADVIHAIYDELDRYPLNYKDVAHHTKADSVLSEVMRIMLSGWSDAPPSAEMKPFWNERHSLYLLKDMILLQREGYSRVVIPSKLKQHVLELLHTSHWGMVRMKELARKHVWWPGIGKDIEQCVTACDICKTNSSNPRASYTPWPQASGPWERLHIDYAGPFESKMWLVCVDAYSKFPYLGVRDVGKTTTKETIAMLLDMFTIEGLPRTLVSDNGPQFSSEEFNHFCQKHDIEHITSPPYNPESNGEAERFVRTMKTAIKKNLSAGNGLTTAIQLFLSTYRSMPHPGLSYQSPASVLHGRQPRGVIELLKPSAHQPVSRSKPESKYSLGSTVYARKLSTWTKIDSRGGNSN